MTMKKTFFILITTTFIMCSCGQTSKKQTTVINNGIVNEQKENDDNFLIKDEKFRQISLDEKIGNRTLEDYLSDEKISQTFKDVFQQRQSLNDDDETLALIDSLFSSDKERHPFYFVLVTRAMWWSDGAFSEPLVMAAKKYVELNTQQFLEYFSTEPVLTMFDFEQWAKYTLYEILVDAEGKEKEQIEKTKNLMTKNCVECSTKKIEMIEKFIENMYVEYDKVQ